MAGNTNCVEGMLGINTVEDPMYFENSTRSKVDRQLEDAKADVKANATTEKDKLYQEFKVRSYEEKIEKLQAKLHKHRMLKTLKEDELI